MLWRLKSYGPKRSEMRPQWFVRPPSMRARHQSNVVPGACVYGSPSISQPPMQPSNSPNGLVGVAAPRRGESYGHAIIFESFSESHIGPASSSRTSAPASASTFAAMPPPAPDPTMHTSKTLGCLMICMGLDLRWRIVLRIPTAEQCMIRDHEENDAFGTVYGRRDGAGADRAATARLPRS